MAKTVNLRIKHDFEDKETKQEYIKGKVYPFSEKRAEELLKNPYIVEKVGETEIEEKAQEKEKTENVTK